MTSFVNHIRAYRSVVWDMFLSAVGVSYLGGAFAWSQQDATA
jgi:hypothetical protein